MKQIIQITELCICICLFWCILLLKQIIHIIELCICIVWLMHVVDEADNSYYRIMKQIIRIVELRMYMFVMSLVMSYALMQDPMFK